MGFDVRSSAAAFHRIYKRQWSDRWHKDYQAAIRATRGEAPRVSQATILTPEKVGLRDFHTLSHAETWAALLALYAPCVWDIHEQRILYPQARRHFLHDHPLGAGFVWSPFRGLLDVAEREGLLKHIRVITLPERGDADSFVRVPMFWVGDLLLFLQDKDGPYPLNWNIKRRAVDFGRPGPRQDGKVDSERRKAQAAARNRIEVIYYADAGIRTIEVAGEAIDFHLRCNLRDLFLTHRDPVAVGADDEARAIELFRAAVGSGESANSVVREVAGRLKFDQYTGGTILRKAIWRREIRVDLFQPFLIDCPLVAERIDPLHQYAEWFRR